jgi:hypothetical protein
MTYVWWNHDYLLRDSLKYKNTVSKLQYFLLLQKQYILLPLAWQMLIRETKHSKNQLKNKMQNKSYCVSSFEAIK